MKKTAQPALTTQEAATILAALRVLQTILAQRKPLLYTPSGVAAMEHFEDVDPLTPEEIDDLCERINIDW